MVVIYIYRDYHPRSEENIFFLKMYVLRIKKIKFAKTKEPIRVRRN